MERRITPNEILSFKESLCESERSRATVEKYMRDIRAFISFLGSDTVSKSTVLSYKEQLTKSYAVSSVNSMLAALNSLFRHL